MRTALDIIIAPREAFARLRETPTWVWALIIVFVVDVLASVAVIPAVKHAMEVGSPALMAHNPAVARLPADQQQVQIAKMLSISLAIANFSWVFILVFVPIVALVQSVVMLVASNIGHGDGTFKQCWSLAVNVQVAGAAGGLVLAIIVLLRGPGSFDRPEQVSAALPSLGMLAPGAPHVLAAFLNGINVAGIWQAVLLALGMIAVGRVAKPVAWTTAIVMLLAIGLFGAVGAVAQGSSN